MKIVRITWHDAEADAEWAKADDPVTVPECETVGFLVKKTRKEIVIAHTRSGDDVNGRFSIPRGCVVRIKEIA
ncbi:MAG: hypothetical protein C4523_02575 [Myxococcales bacterium]|nr:MAG: hypothetical protein C4523_02575 [Myxococcales bacterium]